jgi:FMN reductase
MIYLYRRPLHKHGVKMAATILGIGGSVRADSTAMLALQIALEGTQEAGARTRQIDLAIFPLPLFDGTYSLNGYTLEEHKAIMTLLDATREARGFILASPTYHNTISGSLKNALDFMELLKDDHPPRLEGKVVGLVSVQGGTSGTGNNTLTTMLLAARAMRAWVAPSMVSVPGSREAFDEEGRARDPVINRRLQMLGVEVARASAMFAAYWSLE